ncbi:MAG: hypothetical protein LBD16_01285 [Oscillospiraceae bacterium]|jgi:hypothetical protein|nr:hypothetical protein [Oscillospiraceae bacterium]
MSEYYIENANPRIIDVVEHPSTGDYEYAYGYEPDEAYMVPARESVQRRVHSSVLRAKMLQSERVQNVINNTDIKWQDASLPIEAPIKTVDSDISLKHVLRGTVRRLAGMESEEERAASRELQEMEERERAINKAIEENFTTP